MSDPTPIYIGNVNVDAGMIWVGDPCYVMGDEAPHRVIDWQAFAESTFAEEHDRAEVASEPLGDGVGFAVPSGWGDGAYPVTVTLSPAGRVASVTVTFVDYDDR